MSDPNEQLTGYYSPSTKKVACILLSAALSSDREVSLMFDTKDWFVAPEDDAIRITSPRWQWEAIRDMSPEQRPGPEAFAGMFR